MTTELIILSRCYDLLAWLVPQSERFPRIYRYTVTRRLLAAVLDFQELLVEAQVQQYEARLLLLHRADIRIRHLRLYLRLAHQWHWLSNGQYEHVSRMVSELGRLLGGWIKQTKMNKGGLK